MTADPVIGLRRHTVRLVEHERDWATIFATEAASIRRHLGELAIAVEHVGSTAVDGLAAKPILDIAIAVTDPDAVRAVAERLVGAGYIDRGGAGRNGGHLLVKESAPDIRTVHAHVVEAADPQWADYLFFRDVLRSDGASCRAYDELKHELARTFEEDRGAYTAGKEAFIRRVLERRAPISPGSSGGTRDPREHPSSS